MARIRTLKPSFWEDPDVCKLSRDARLTAIALISYADDRGRMDFSPAAIRGYAFRRDDVSDRRVHTWITDVVQAGMALAYEVAGFAYLWLPRFWRHQVINRPAESQLPAHPDDPYGHLPIKEALAQFRDDSLSDSVSDSRSNHGGLTASRAGVRSLPIPSSPVVDVPNSNDSGDSNPGRPARKRVDQGELPAELPGELHAAAAEVVTILHGVWEVRGGAVEPQERGVGLGMVRSPRCDHVSVARRLEHWLLAGKGQRASTADIAKRFADWCAEEPQGAAARSANGRGVSAAQDDLEARRHAALRQMMAERGATFA